MENTKFPIVVKKRNGLMLGISILEILIGVIFGIAGGFKSAPLWVFLFIGVVTALSVIGEYNQDILLKENKVEFYKNNDLIKAIKYSTIDSIYIGKGNEPKNKKKDFLIISFSEKNKSKKDSKTENYLINLMNYSSGDLRTIINTIGTKNSSVKVSEQVEALIK